LAGAGRAGPEWGILVGCRRLKNASILWFRDGGTEDFFRGFLRSCTVCAFDLYRGLGGRREAGGV
jgi:hypothetical protein